MTVEGAANALRISERQIYRIKARVAAQGPEGVIHGNKGQEPHNKTPNEVRDRAIELAQNEYAQFNFSHLAESLAEEHGIELSDETLGRWMRPIGHGGPLRRHKKHRKRRKRKEREGEMLFLDGSPHHWFGEDEPECCLILASDDGHGHRPGSSP